MVEFITIIMEFNFYHSNKYNMKQYDDQYQIIMDHAPILLVYSIHVKLLSLQLFNS